jgi:hypothetical protein
MDHDAGSRSPEAGSKEAERSREEVEQWQSNVLTVKGKTSE